MAAQFNAIPFEALNAFLTAKGFIGRQPESLGLKAHEWVFERANHNDGQLMVVVYTSAVSVKGTVRWCGKDALRVALVADLADGRRIGLARSKRVNRCGETAAILERLYERMREMYALANQMAKGARCSCGAPRYPDTGKCVRKCYVAKEAK